MSKLVSTTKPTNLDISLPSQLSHSTCSRHPKWPTGWNIVQCISRASRMLSSCIQQMDPETWSFLLPHPSINSMRTDYVTRNNHKIQWRTTTPFDDKSYRETQINRGRIQSNINLNPTNRHKEQNTPYKVTPDNIPGYASEQWDRSRSYDRSLSQRELSLRRCAFLLPLLFLPHDLYQRLILPECLHVDRIHEKLKKHSQVYLSYRLGNRRNRSKWGIEDRHQPHYQ